MGGHIGRWVCTGAGGRGSLGYREEDYVNLCGKRERAGRGVPA